MRAKRLLLVGIAIALVVTFCFAATDSAPPPPPPDRIGISMVCLNTETRMPEDFKGTWDGSQVPWLLTSAEVHFKMLPDGTVAVAEAWIVVVDIQGHFVKSMKIK